MLCHLTLLPEAFDPLAVSLDLFWFQSIDRSGFLLLPESKAASVNSCSLYFYLSHYSLFFLVNKCYHSGQTLNSAPGY